MADGILGNALGAFGFPKTYILTDENGNELVGVVTESEIIFTATDNDVREGSVYAGDGGVSTGTKEIPPYYARYGLKVLLAGKEAIISVPKYNYSNLLITISTYDTDINQSVDVSYVSVDNSIYEIGNSIKISDAIMNEEAHQIELGVTVSEKSVLRYSVIMEEIE